MKRSKLKRDTLYRSVIALGYSGAMTLLVFSKVFQVTVLVFTGIVITTLFYKLIK